MHMGHHNKPSYAGTADLAPLDSRVRESLAMGLMLVDADFDHELNQHVFVLG